MSDPQDILLCQGQGMDINNYVKLWRLGKHRLRSKEDYKKFQAFQATLLLRYLRGFGINIQGKRVLDLGSGIGGYSEEMVRYGATVISLDLIKPSCRLMQGHNPIIANALSIPLCDEGIDFVFCASLIEHVSDPVRLLAEIQRVLKEGGHCYLSFPPFYNPRGGHEFSPFHYLGEYWAIRLTRQRRRHPEWIINLYEVSLNPQSFSETYQGWGLFRMTIAKAKRLIASTRLKIINMSTRYLPISMIRWPILGEIFTWHAQFLLMKL